MSTTHRTSARKAFTLSLLAGLMALGMQSAMAASAFEAPDPNYKGMISAQASGGAAILAGSEVTLNGRGFTPGQQITLSRGATVLNTGNAYVADAEGNFKATIRIPEDAAPGQHPIVVTTVNPSYSAVFPLKVSPVVPLSGANLFSQASAKLVQGLYQSDISAKNGSVFVTSAVGLSLIHI